MDGKLFDRMVRTLGNNLPRRGALATFAAGMAALAGRSGIDEASAKKKHKRKKKKKERKLGQTCGGKKKCSKKNGPVSCTSVPNFECIDVEFTVNRCCGLEGTICDPDFGTPALFGNCSCCESLFCGQQPSGEFRCQTEDT